MIYRIMVNGKPLATINEDGTANGLATITEQAAIALCKRLDGVIGEVRYLPTVEPSDVKGFNQETAKTDFKLPSEGKTIYNITSVNKSEGFEK